MASGGKREGSGRKPGTLNKRTAEQAAAVEASGLTPLDYMLAVMRDLSMDDAKRLDAAKAAAPYVHAKLSSMELTGKDGGAVKQSLEVSFVE